MESIRNPMQEMCWREPSIQTQINTPFGGKIRAARSVKEQTPPKGYSGWQYESRLSAFRRQSHQGLKRRNYQINQRQKH